MTSHSYSLDFESHADQVKWWSSTRRWCCSLLVTILSNTSVLAQDATSGQAKEVDNTYRPCIEGPSVLRGTDQWEEQHKAKALITINGKKKSPEVMAEMFISDCSAQLSVMNGLAATGNEPAQMTVGMWSTNLEFMKWWLDNRQKKYASRPNQRK